MAKAFIKEIICKKCGKLFVPIFASQTDCHDCKKIDRQSISTEIPTDISAKSTEVSKDVLSENHKIKICQLLACFTPLVDVKKYMHREYAIVLNMQVIKSLRDTRKWQPIIARFRKDWLQEVNNVPLANRRVRLEYYQEIFTKCMEKNKFANAMSALNSAREEMDERKLGSTQYTLNYISQMSDEELLKKKDEIIKRIKKMPRFGITGRESSDKPIIDIDADENVDTVEPTECGESIEEGILNEQSA